MKLLVLLFLNLFFLQINAEQNISTIRTESSNILSTLIITPIFFLKNQIVLPNEFDESIRISIESKLNAGNNLYNYQNKKFNIELAAFKNIPRSTQYVDLFNQIRNINPPIEVKSEILKDIDKSLIIPDKSYLLIGQLEQLSFTQYIDYIEKNKTFSYINNLLIEVRYYIISLATKKYVYSFIATGDTSIAKIGSPLNLDYDINQLITNLFFDLKSDTINHINVMNNYFYGSYNNDLRKK
jgi:hypothetical protein